MGWHAACTLISAAEVGYLATFPKHDPALAKVLLNRLALGRFRSAGMSSFGHGLNPHKQRIYVGAYGPAAIVGDFSLANDLICDSARTKARAIDELFPGCRVLSIVLSSTVNLFGYGYYRYGKLVRARAGAADEGIYLDRGDPLPEELPLYAKSTVCNGKRVFFETVHGEAMKFSETAFGEEFVCEVARHLLGCRLDAFAIRP